MSDNPIAYLDHAATTPMRAEAAQAIYPWMGAMFGNPSGGHSVARRALRAIDEAREELAGLLGCEPGEVVFTSGGTESDNLAVTGTIAGSGRIPVCSAVEHHAVLAPCAAAGGRQVGVDRNGVLDLDQLEHSLKGEASQGGEVGLVSVMLANNEVGVIQPIAEVVELTHRLAPHAFIHTDAVHGVAWMDVATEAALADLVSISAHKFGGPPGVGALVVRSNVRISPVILGGAQERERRAGSQNVAGILGMTAALRVTTSEREEQVRRVGSLRDRLATGLSGIPGVSLTVDGATSGVSKVAGSCHVIIENVEQEEALLLLDEAGVCASAGSACASGAIEPSHVLLAMGLSAQVAKSAVRLTLGHTSNDSDVDHALEVFPAVVERLTQ